MALTKAQKENAERNRRYWEQREADALKHRITDEKEFDKQLHKIYANMLDNIQNEINAFYGRYASKEGISIAEAKKRVSALDIKAYERKAKRYVKEKDFSAEANEEMRLYNLTMKVNRLELLKANIGLEMIAGHDEIKKFMEGILQGRTEDELKRQAGILGKSVTNNGKAARVIVNGSFHNATFSDRIWQYHDLMKADLSKVLQTGLIQGKNPRAIGKELYKYWYGNDPRTGGGAQYCMERLMRTELARVQTEAQKESFIRNGFSMYTFHTNSGCCDICKALNGKHFKIDDMMPGKNASPMHPHCRCSASAYEDTDEYNEWLDYVSKGGTTEEWNKLKERVEMKTTFVPAKTIQEAEEYAKAKGVKYADYSKLPIKTANEMNKALDTLPDDVRPVFVGASSTLEQYWGGKLPRTSKQFYGVSIDVFDGIHLGMGKGIDFDTQGKMVAISSSYKAADKITEAKKKAQELYKTRHNGRSWFFNVSGETTPFHEMGHVYVGAKGLPKGFEADALKWAEETKCDMLTNPNEAFAEAWASYHTDINEIPDYIRKYFDDIVKG